MIRLSNSEWEVLRLVNRERFKAGLNVLAMPEALQAACNMKKERNTYTVKLSGKTVELTIGKEQSDGRFKDVKLTDWFSDAVAWALENGVTSGTSDTTFSPNDTCTGGQIVTFLKRALN